MGKKLVKDIMGKKLVKDLLRNLYRTCSIIRPPQINALPPFRGLSYCAGFLSRKHAPPPRSDLAACPY